MNGMRPEFLKNVPLQNDYFAKPNPYTSAPSCHVNLLELSRYAKKQGKQLSELTEEEIRKFSF